MKTFFCGRSLSLTLSMQMNPFFIVPMELAFEGFRSGSCVSRSTSVVYTGAASEATSAYVCICRMSIFPCAPCSYTLLVLFGSAEVLSSS
jgi:hypothetical protein